MAVRHGCVSDFDAVREASLTIDSVFGLTAYTTDINLIVAEFGFDKEKNPNYLPITPISGYSLYLFGIFFAPVSQLMVVALNMSGQPLTLPFIVCRSGHRI